MASNSRIVLDTNVIISALLAFSSTPGLAVDWTLRYGIPLASEPSIRELNGVLLKPKLVKLISISIRSEFLDTYNRSLQLIQIKSSILDCRDPRDNKFLELAVDGDADVIVSGDEDLLSLDPYQRIRILTPQAFLAGFVLLPDEGSHT